MSSLSLRASLLGLAAAAIVVLSPIKAEAAEPKLIGTYGDWAAYTFQENGNKVCYMATKPAKAEGNYTRRGDVFALVTHRPAENSKDVFSYITGYTYKTNSDVSLVVDGNKRYTLFTHKDMAWANTTEDDRAIAQSLRKGSRFVVKGTSSRGTLTTDTFSLKGSSAAHDAINKACK
jgi:hypothetical protein